MKVGFGRIDITPPLGTTLCGHLVPLPAESVESRLYARAMCLDDGNTAVLIASCDVVMVTNETANQICSDAETATGVPAPNIIVCATHTHSGPSLPMQLPPCERKIRSSESGLLSWLETKFPTLHSSR